jgi:DNA-binding Lrp family transcriptional regulator
MSDFQLTPLKKKILNEFYFDFTQNYTQISNRLKISRQTVSKHSNELKEQAKKAQFFKKARVLNPFKTNDRVFFAEIKTNPGEKEIIPGLMDLEKINSLDGIIGNTSLIAKFRVDSSEKINDVLERIDEVLSKSEFQYYKLIDILSVFKSSGKNFDENSPKEISSIAFYPEYIKKTDYPFKWYLQLRPNKSTKFNHIAWNFLVHFDEIVDLYRTGQEFGLLAVVRTNSVEEYQKFLQTLYQSKHFQDSFTIFVLDERMPSTFKPYKSE